MHASFIILAFVLLSAIPVKAQISEVPDFTKKENLAGLGTGRIVEKDNSTIKRIILLEVKEYWIVYIKDESTHDLAMELIRRIEFPDSKWGALKVEFINNKLQISRLIQ